MVNFWRWLYTVLFYLLLPFVYLRLLLRSKRLPAYRQRILERFGYFKMNAQYKRGIWVHVVSLGEMIAATPLIKLIQSTCPEIPLVLTCMTPTGSVQILKVMGEKVFHVYAPYDLPTCTVRFLKKIEPRLVIIMETELWPNWLHQLSRRNIPVLLANARLSEKSFNNYSRVPILAKSMMQSLSILAVQSAIEADRFIQLGAALEKTQVTGNLKFDIAIPDGLLEKAKELRSQLGAHRQIWIAASTHPGEEEQILAAFSTIKKRHPAALLVLVPRHPDRFAEVIALCRQQYSVVVRTDHKNCIDQDDVFVGNTVGEMLLFYAASDIAFVGGSLINRGGHNMLEPALFGLPIISGQYIFNFTEVSQLLLKANGLVLVNSPEQLANIVIDWMNHRDQARVVGDAARQVMLNNRGALDKHMQLISSLL